MPSMILKLWVHGLWRFMFWLIYNPNKWFKTRGNMPTRSRQPSCTTDRTTNLDINFIRRCASLMSRPIPRIKNRHHPRPSQPSYNLIQLTRVILRPMFWNLRIKSQLYAYCSRNSTTKTFWELIYINNLITVWSLKQWPFKLKSENNILHSDMPQLDTSTWFITILSSTITLFVLIQLKISIINFPLSPSIKSTELVKIGSVWLQKI